MANRTTRGAGSRETLPRTARATTTEVPPPGDPARASARTATSTSASATATAAPGAVETPPTSFTVSGIVFEAGSKRGVGGLLVTAYHLMEGVEERSGADPEAQLKNALRLGTVPTREGSGEFVLSIAAADLPSHDGRPRLDLVIAVAAPDDERSSSAGKTLYVSAPRLNAARLEHFQVGLARETLERFSLSDTATAKESLAAYRERLLSESELATGIVDIHRAAVEQRTAGRERIRAQVLERLMTDPRVASLPGEVVGPDDDIREKVDKVLERGVTTANATIRESAGVPVNLYLTPDDRAWLAPYFEAAVDGVATIPEHVLGPILFRSREQDNPGAVLINQNPIAKYCATQTFVEKCARAHTGLPADTDHAVEHGGAGGESSGSPGGGGPTTDGTATAALSDDAIAAHAARLLADAPSPDSVLDPALGQQRPDRTTVESAVDGFSLRKGPADVAAFYDFSSLQVAFDHVWKILVDEDLVSAGFAADAIFRQKTGVPLADALPRNWLDISSFADFATILPRDMPAEVAAHFDITQEEWSELDASRQAKLTAIARELDRMCGSTIEVPTFLGTINIPVGRLGTLHCERRRQELREQGERIIEGVRHDDYYTLHRTLRELHDRINAKYEFTVFAADKDRPTVNFGLVTTWRLMMDPISYQPGRLVKTIPLAPKEERTYSVKVTRTLKQERKEALKNNSTLTSEQSSTSRAEAEIMRKAQAKTTFGLSADGSYNIGIAKGKSKTTFGVDALQESAETRKDFREAVVKAAQEYKEERVVEVTTEETTGSEYTETGTIRNQNEEISVTYLFYELQRRYRISERLHRVTPVVLVAQEVPAPHQITEGWVIAHDWVINRVLLDDSFRPALQYLANKSVGDDFAVRELRRNLRQQRNLVETLRIELAIASHEAESRYRALESAIEKRIGEEQAEKTDGWFDDIVDFFGGGGQDPEAAKAREMAARDAHQYAVEKMEKAAAALRQEMGVLHALTLEYNHALQKHLDNETRVKRLLAHIRSNILYYMQAIWAMEPDDQRILRLHKVQVPVLKPAKVPDPTTGELVTDRHYKVVVEPEEDIFASFREPGTTKHRAFMSGSLEPVTEFVPLAQVADIGSPLGFLGNYMVFPLKEHNALTEFMAAPFVDSAFGAMDPDSLSNVTLQEYGRYVCCLHERLTPEEFEEMKPVLRKWLERLLSDPLRNGDEITVPTDSLFIEVLPGAHPVLEDFKLRHRQLDVMNVAEDVRRKQLEALRLAARLLHEEREDPDIEKKIVVAGAVQPGIDIGDDA